LGVRGVFVGERIILHLFFPVLIPSSIPCLPDAQTGRTNAGGRFPPACVESNRFLTFGQWNDFVARLFSSVT
jgi:hypothetical protein